MPACVRPRANSSGLNVVADWSCTLTGRRSSLTLRSTTVTGISCASLGRASVAPGAYSSTESSKIAAWVWPRKPSCEVITRVIVKNYFRTYKANPKLRPIQPTDPSSSGRNRTAWAAAFPNPRRSWEGSACWTCGILF